ncbi:hypothetical protein Bbelb_357250 [Branchiostoma belcheri]|nr:hypothetical protein Bbelb_357250 [Branchiostoma belcheri]
MTWDLKRSPYRLVQRGHVAVVAESRRTARGLPTAPRPFTCERMRPFTFTNPINFDHVSSLENGTRTTDKGSRDRAIRKVQSTPPGGSFICPSADLVLSSTVSPTPRSTSVDQTPRNP